MREQGFRPIRPIKKGGETFIDYQLQTDGRRRVAINRTYASRCGSVDCQETMRAASST